MRHDRRTFLRALGASGIGAVAAGTVGTAGAQELSGEFVVEGAGDDIWNAADECYFAFEAIEGDFDVTVRVDSVEDTDEWAKAGLMVRESLDADASNAMIRATPGHDTSVQWRPEAGDDAGSTTSDLGEDRSEISGGTIDADWQRLVRDGDTLEAYVSEDGSDWTRFVELSIGDDVDLGAVAHLGIAVTSRSSSQLATAEFSDLDGVAPAHGHDVGSVDPGAILDESGAPLELSPLVTTGEAADFEEEAATVTGALEALADSSTVAVGFEYREAGASSWMSTDTETLSGTGSVEQELTGLSVETDYEFRAVAEDGDGATDAGRAEAFATLGPDYDPIVETAGTSELAAASASLEGYVESVGGHATEADVGFEYRETGESTWTATPTETVESDESFVRTVTDLAPETAYEFRAVAEADDGDTGTGDVETFETDAPDPLVSTDAATSVTDASATLSGSVELDGAPSADVYAEYRETGESTWESSTSQELTSSGTFSTTVSGLRTEAEHEFRAVADVEGGDVHTGSAETFTTEERDPIHEDRVTMGNVGAESPSSPFAPDDGFADTSWIADKEFVVLRVTNLDADGEGSLKWAIESNLGDIGLEEGAPRLIVFEVGGVIDLRDDDIDGDSRKHIYVAGQTAPPPGITIIRSQRPGIEFDEENQFVQHIRSMPGDDTSDAADSMVAGDDAYNVCFDHCTVAWGTEESMSVNAGDDSEDFTFCNNMIAEPLFDSPAHGGDDTRAYGTLLGNDADRLALLGNLYAHTWSRNPRLKGGTQAFIANNVWYNFERGSSLGGDVDTPNYASYVQNRYIEGEATDFDRPIIYTYQDGGPDLNVYLEDNYYDDGYTMVDEDDDLFVVHDEPFEEYWPEDFTPLDEDPTEQVLSHAGARPAERIEFEERIVEHVENREGEIIDSQEEVGGYPDLPTNYRELEIPEGDVTDWLIQHTRAVELGEDPPEEGGDPGEDVIEFNGYEAQDTTGSGLYNDITGDGSTGHEDVTTFFEHLGSDAIEDNPEAFAFDSDEDNIGFNDVLALFEKID